MPRYRIFYLKDSHIATFRESVPKHPYRLKPGHYDEAGEVESPGPYAVWQLLQGEEAERRGLRSLGVGDVIEEDPSTAYLCNFWGFDPAEWVVPQGDFQPPDDLPQGQPGGGQLEDPSTVSREAAAF